MYADDISLLSSTVSGLQDTLGVCVRYADNLLLFNIKKSVRTKS